MRFNAAMLTCVFLLLAPAAATADDVVTSIPTDQNVPATITRCQIKFFSTSLFTSSFNIYNRSSHDLIDASIDYRFYDRDNAQIGNSSFSYTLSQTLSSQDTVSLNENYHPVILGEPSTAVSRVTCRLTQAHFTGRFAWKRGTTWLGGPLSPVPRVDSRSSASASVDASAAESHVSGKVISPVRQSVSFRFEVKQAWNDVVQGGVLVHDALIIHGGDAPLTVHPNDFLLTMSLLKGGQKAYAALDRAAPTYQKFSPLTNQTATAYEIEPKSDLGGLGSMIVPAHTNVEMTVTFAVTDQIADITANRTVSLR